MFSTRGALSQHGEMSSSAGGLLTAQTWPVIPLVSKVCIALRQQGREELERGIVGRLARVRELVWEGA